MPDIPPDGAANDSANGHLDSQPTSLPRIIAPTGARAARGADFSAGETEPVSDPETVSDLETGAIDENGVVPSLENSVEDSYDLPLELDPQRDDEARTASANGASNPDTPRDVELGLMQHLGELRKRMLYCALILMGGMALTWNFSPTLQKWFAEPIAKVLKEKGGEIISTDPTGFFSITVQFSMVSALILTAPLLFWQIWAFIEPALTKAERRYAGIVVPFSSALFFTGAALSYAVSPLFFKFFLAFQPDDVAAKWNYYDSVVLMAKMLLAFGVMFQVPVVVIFLNKLGLLSRNVLIEYWRHAVVLIFLVAAIVTPTWDPVTLAVCAVPPCLLYVLSIWLVKWL